MSLNRNRKSQATRVSFSIGLISVLGLALYTGCPSPPAVAKVSRLNPLYSLRVKCADFRYLWRGPANSTVHLDLLGDQCAADLEFVDRGTQKRSATGNTAQPGATKTVALVVPDPMNLVLSCPGEGEGECACKITAVDPPLPANVTLGAPQAIPQQPGVKDPAAGVTPAVGTPVDLTCGHKCTLWSGPESYVTIVFKGATACNAKLLPARTGHGTAGGEEITDDKSYCRTYGPITSVTATCEGNGAKSCEFQVVEVIELP
jgi:hypothetical protein